MNYVRIMEPAPNDDVFTNDGTRLFVPIAMKDQSGAIDLRTRDKPALEHSSLSNKEEFKEESKQGGLNFPILCSVRVHLKKQKSDDEQESISAVVVEAAAQDFSKMSMPNTSVLELHKLFKEYM